MSKAKTNAKTSKNATSGTGTTVDVDANAAVGSMDSNDAGANDQVSVKSKHSKETHEVMKHYVKVYPKAKHFLIASDGQVFLPANELDAKAHQTKLDAKKELVKYVSGE